MPRPSDSISATSRFGRRCWPGDTPMINSRFHVISFRQARSCHNHARSLPIASDGSGLGLPTVKRLVEAHQGEVSIECPPAGGTTVVVRLPLSPS